MQQRHHQQQEMIHICFRNDALLLKLTKSHKVEKNVHQKKNLTKQTEMTCTCDQLVWTFNTRSQAILLTP